MTAHRPITHTETHPKAKSLLRIFLVAGALLAGAIAPRLAAQTYVPPVDKTVALGTTLALSINTSGSNMQWYKNDVAISGATTSTYTISNAKATDSAKYTFDVTQSDNSVWIYTINVTVSNQTGIVVTKPKDTSVAAGGTATFSVAVSSSASGITYQWRHNSVDIAGATSDTLTLNNVATYQRGTYSVAVSNSSGLVEEDPATLTVTSDARLVNLSTRANVGTGDDVAIAGFVLSGGGSKTILMRGIGPTLNTAFGVTGVLANPIITLHAADSTVITATTGAWGGGSDLAQLFNQLGAFALPADSTDAAFTATLTGAPYSFVVEGKNGTTGVVMAEIYDAAPTTASPHLVNISSRAKVGTGDQTLIAGFVISGTTSETVLIRGVGPSLKSRFGLNAAATATKVTLFDSKSNVLATNTSWDSDANVAPAAKAVGAFDLDAGSKDAALLVTLAPGIYSTFVTGEGGASGTGMVEIYEVP